jgi:electron transport complex protein RnfG
VRDLIRLSGRLFLIALVAGLALGATYYVTKEPIERQKALASASARGQVIDGQAVPDERAVLTGNIRSVLVTADGGRVVEVAATGYGGEFLVTVGIESGGTITGVIIGENNETVGLGKNAEKPEFTGQYVNQNAELEVVKDGAGAGEIDALTGATITSRAVTDAVNEARAYALALGGVGK